jgi:hypothetical protein
LQYSSKWQSSFSNALLICPHKNILFTSFRKILLKVITPFYVFINGVI